MFLCNGGKGYRGEFVYIRDDREAGVGVEYFSLCEVRVFGLQGGSASTCPALSNVLVIGPRYLSSYHQFHVSSIVKSSDAAGRHPLYPHPRPAGHFSLLGHVPRCNSETFN